ncbi:hypothetical protein J132_07636, partial [Termitomyces sp. J132]
GHCPLNHYLHHFNRKDLPLCDTCHQAPEMVAHYLLECHVYDRFHYKMHRTTGMRPEAMSKLLTEEDAIRVLFRYINCTH